MKNLVDTSICCLITYNSNLVYVEAIMINNGFQILFNSKPIAQIIKNQNMTWEIYYGALLPDDIISEIGKRIERKFNY